MLDNQYAILFIRGERPVKDFKYDILKHPNISLTTDGKGKEYLHGQAERAIGTIQLASIVRVLKDTKEKKEQKNNETIQIDEKYEMITNEELEERLKIKIRKGVIENGNNNEQN